MMIVLNVKDRLLHPVRIGAGVRRITI